MVIRSRCAAALSVAGGGISETAVQGVRRAAGERRLGAQRFFDERGSAGGRSPLGGGGFKMIAKLSKDGLQISGPFETDGFLPL